MDIQTFQSLQYLGNDTDSFPAITYYHILRYFICKILVGTVKLISDCIARMHYTIDYFLCLLLI